VLRTGLQWQLAVGAPLSGGAAHRVRAGAEPKAVKNRVHLDLATRSAEHQASLVQRVRDHGARPPDIGQGDVPWVVLADSEGNEFCVLTPR